MVGTSNLGSEMASEYSYLLLVVIILTRWCPQDS